MHHVIKIQKSFIYVTVSKYQEMIKENNLFLKEIKLLSNEVLWYELELFRQKTLTGVTIKTKNVHFYDILMSHD